MVSHREQIMVALESALATLPVTVARNADVPVTIDSNGYIILRDHFPVIEDGTLGTTRSWYMRLDAELEIYVNGGDGSNRSTKLDTLINSAISAIDTSDDVISLVNHIEPIMVDHEILFQDGAESIQAALINLQVEYDASTSVG